MTDDRGLRCPRCHCTDLRNTGGTVLHYRSKIRYRVCRHCGQRVRTRETILNAPESPDARADVPVSEESDGTIPECGVVIFAPSAALPDDEANVSRHRHRRRQC